MKAFISNKFIVVRDPTESFIQRATKALHYVDKSVQYQLKRMAKNPFLRNSVKYAQLEQQVHGYMYQWTDNGDLVFPTGMISILDDEKGIERDDRRCLTGQALALPWAQKPFDLRNYQEEAVGLMENNYRGVIELATGLGKTLLAVHAIKRIRRKTLVVVPSESVALQFYEILAKSFGSNKVGLFGGNKRKISDITVGIAASVNNHVEKFKGEDLGLIIFDETHHTPASTFYNIAKELGSVGKIFGLTATNYRSDGKDLLIEAGVGNTLIVRDVKLGVDNGWLAKPKFIVHRIKTGDKDFASKLQNYKYHVLNNTLMNNTLLIDAKDALCRNKKVLILVAEIDHGEYLAQQLGCKFAKGEDKQSQKYVEEFNKGQTNCLIGTMGKISEGSDIRPTDCLFMLGFNASKGTVMQAVGRGLRKQGNKTECEIHDYIPEGSEMLKRHALGRVGYYKEITDDVEIME